MIFQSYRTKYNGVPILKKAEIDVIAEKFVLDFNPAVMLTPMEIDIDSFVLNYLGLKQDFQFLSHNGVYLGMMVFNDTDRIPVYVPEANKAEYISARAGTVIIDNSLLEKGQEHRYRYTMGHEAGHNIFHKKYFCQNKDKQSRKGDVCEYMVQCRAVSFGRMRNDGDWMEWQANYFSAAVLMPRSMVLKLTRSMGHISLEIKNFMYAREVSKTFNVSFQAAVNRLKCLGIIDEWVQPSYLSAVADFA